MKPPIAFAPVALATAIVAPPAAAYDSFCFMKTEGGQAIDLTQLCSQSSRSTASQAIPKSAAVSRPEVIRTGATARIQSSVNRWQRAAQSTAAMRPSWSGHCQSAGQPCHAARPAMVHISRVSLADLAAGRVCSWTNNVAADGSQCGERSAQTRRGR